jgi:hypothetical protein
MAMDADFSDQGEREATLDREPMMVDQLEELEHILREGK